MEALTATSVWTLLGAFGGGAFVKLIDARLRMRTKALDLGISLRDELHAEVKDLKAQQVLTQRDCDDWRKAYYSSREEAAALKADVLLLQARLKRTEESDAARQKRNPQG